MLLSMVEFSWLMPLASAKKEREKKNIILFGAMSHL